jgi:hypothetical protein
MESSVNICFAEFAETSNFIIWLFLYVSHCEDMSRFCFAFFLQLAVGIKWN